MGVVYKAEHLRLPRFAAIKVLSCSPAQDEGVLDRFFFEMEAIAKLNHPNIVSAIDAGVAEPSTADQHSLYYFVMDYVPGQTLEQIVLEKGAMDLLKACDIIYQVAAGILLWSEPILRS
jgi:serine/threonine-protein kinase